MKRSKFFLVSTIFLLVLSFVTFIPKTQATTKDFDYQYVAQSPNPTLNPGQSVILWVKLKNTGNKAWHRNVVRLGTSNPKDRNSVFMPNLSNAPELANVTTNWISTNRVIMEKETAEVGETVGFGFYIKAPETLAPGTYKEYFQPVVDGAYWMKDIGIYWEITVVSAPPSITPIDYGTDLDSFIEASKTCTPSKVIYTLDPTDIFGMIISGDSLFEIRGIDSVGKCMFYMETLSIHIEFSNELIQSMLDDGKTLEEIEAERARIENEYIEPSIPQVCKFNPDDLTAMLNRWKEGDFESGASCSIVDGNWECTYTGDFADAECEPVGIQPTPPPSIIGTYDYEFITQSPYPSTLAPSTTTDVWIEIKNTGTATWYNHGNNPVRLGTGSSFGNINQQRDYLSEFAASDWLSQNRPAAILQDEVSPGETARFQFTIQAPATPGTYKAYFTPVVDGLMWMKDMGIYWEIKVLETPAYQYELISQTPSSPINMTPSEIKDASIKIKNTGSATWSNSGTNKIVLGWGSVHDDSVNQINGFASGVETTIVQSQVAPGEIGEFKFQIKAPANIGNYKAYFTPMVQNIYPQPFKDIGIYWELSVNNVVQQVPATPTGLRVFATTNNTVSLSWNAVSGATKYELYRSSQLNGSYSVVYSGTYTSYTDTGLGVHTTYYYKVLARNDSGTSTMSAPVTATLTPAISPAPSAPSNLKAEQCLTQALCISWMSAIKSVAGGEIVKATDELYRSTNANSGFSLIYSGTEGFYQDSNVVAGTTYYYKVRRTYFDSTGYSDFSEPVSATLKVSLVPSDLTISTDKTSLPADGVTYATIKVNVLKNYTTPIAGAKVTLALTRGNTKSFLVKTSGIEYDTDYTDANGEVLFYVKDTYPSVTSYYAYVYDDFNISTNMVDITFYHPDNSSANIALNKNVTASSYYMSRVPNKVTDGKIGRFDDGWVNYLANPPTITSPQWLNVDLGSIKSINRLIIKSIKDTNNNYSPKNLTVKFSNDNIDWTTYGSITNNNSILMDFDILPSVSARYIKIEIKESNHISSQPQVYVEEVEVYSPL